MPFVAVEDTEAGVIWGAQLAAGGPWQLELIRGRDGLAISGGPADRDLGGGRIVLGPGESYEAPEAVVSVVQGGLDELCARLTSAQSGHPRPGLERGLPIQFNEYATTWGNPTHNRVLALADRLQGTGVRYFTVDCGWFTEPGADWGRSHGDWEPSTARFPGGLAATARALRERGFVPGLWWEPETTGELSKAYADPEPHVHRDGAPVHVSARRFLDLRRPEVTGPLLERMAAVLKDFGYLKIDYNANLVAEGEVVRELTAASQDFIRALSARLPHLVIENCSGGGHRISPAYAALTAVTSGSDAFEAREAPVIAANLQRVLLPRQSLVWATVRADDTESDLVYKLAMRLPGPPVPVRRPGSPRRTRLAARHRGPDPVPARRPRHRRRCLPPQRYAPGRRHAQPHRLAVRPAGLGRRHPGPRGPARLRRPRRLPDRRPAARPLDGVGRPRLAAVRGRDPAAVAVTAAVDRGGRVALMLTGSTVRPVA